ncbi:MAG: alkaline phosphatase [Verrucomicrobiales bacterium]|nr:alkaline phosphatase [Verrucomicrobiales bacterium]
MRTNRRRFFGQTGVLAGTALGLPGIGRAADGPTAEPHAKPRHIIHMVADGMCWSTFSMGDTFSHLRRGRGLRWLDLYHEPQATVTTMDMRSLNSLVTDSAAASSSWGSGSRVVNGTLNVLPDGRELIPLCSLFREAGWKRGLVTTTEITHATPAGFAASIDSRGNAQMIARQYLDRRVDVLLGGGHKFFDAAKRSDKQDLYATYREAGYTVMRDAGELTAAPREGRWLGTFASSHLPFSIDRDHSTSLKRKVPTLADMTRRALERLGGEDHFLLQVEGGRVDHACHACDIASAVRELVAFDEALEVCLEYQRRVPETLIILTTDHGTGGPSLNGIGSAYGESSARFANLLKARRSFESMLPDLPKEPTAAAIGELIEDGTGYEVPDRKMAALLGFLDKQWQPLFDGMNGQEMQFGQLLGNHYGVTWTSGAHTSDYVPLLAYGPGAAKFRGFQRNTDVFRHYTTLAGIDYRNPEMPLMAECGPSAHEVETDVLPV